METTTVQMAQRDLAELGRSCKEARKTQVRIAESDRYLDPPGDTPYSLEYAFHLLGDVAGKTVLDLGCGSGENLVPLLRRGARAIGIDISPELIALSRQRLALAGLQADLRVGSAYETGLRRESVDVVFCMSLVHHLDIPVAREEMRRVLKRGGRIIFKEPIRFSKTLSRLRALLPRYGDNSEFEHPLTQSEIRDFTEGFTVEKVRYFHLPVVPLVERTLRTQSRSAWLASHWCLENLAFLQRYATAAVGRMVDRREAMAEVVEARRGGDWPDPEVPQTATRAVISQE